MSTDYPISHSDDEEEETPNYGDIAYWNNRYIAADEIYDWYQSWSDLLPIFQPLFSGNERILNIGCGNSCMSAEMATSTFSDVVSIDKSPIVIDQMKRRFAHIPACTWFVMDCTNLRFPPESFDIIFDKATIDSLFCGDDGDEIVSRTLMEIYRVLKPGGLCIIISHSPPDARLDLFRSDQLNWYLHEPMIIEHPEDDNSYHFGYIFQKMSGNYTIIEEEVEEYEEEEDQDCDEDNVELNENFVEEEDI